MDANTLPYRAQPKSILKTREVHGRAKDGGHVPHGTNGKWNDHTTRIAETRIDMSDDAKTVTHFDEVEMSPTPGRNKPTTKATEFERMHTREQWKQESSRRQWEISRSHETPEMRAQRKQNFDPDASWTVGHVTEEDISEEEQAVKDRFTAAKANARANSLGVKPTSQESQGAKALHVPSPSEIKDNRAALEKKWKEQKEKSTERTEKRRLDASHDEDKDPFTEALKHKKGSQTRTVRELRALQKSVEKQRKREERKRAEKSATNAQAERGVERSGMSITNDIDNDRHDVVLENMPKRVAKAPATAARTAAMQRQIDAESRAISPSRRNRLLACGIVCTPPGVATILAAHYALSGEAQFWAYLGGVVLATVGAVPLLHITCKLLEQHCMAPVAGAT